MKRFLILFLALILIVGTIACGGSNNDDPTPSEQPSTVTDPTAVPSNEGPAPTVTEEPAADLGFTPGKYGIVKYEVDGYAFEGDALISAGLADTFLVLNADHTGTFTIMDSPLEIGWDEDGNVTVSGYPVYSMKRVDGETIEFLYVQMLLTLKLGYSATAGTGDAPEPTAEPAAPAVTEAPASDPEAAFPGAPYGTSDGVIDRDKLAGLYRWMNELPSEFLYALTFDEIGAAAGKQGHDQQNNDGKYQSATWSDGDKAIVTVTFKDQGNGSYAYNAIVISGISRDEYSVADVSGFPKIASSTPAGTNPTETQTFEAKVGFSGPKVNITASIPTKNWYLQKKYIYCAPNAERADRSQSYFKIECQESLEKIDFYKDSFENLEELAPRTIGGIEMQGRSYKNVGMEWIEYYGEIAEGVWVSIKLTGLDLSEGTETEAILMSLTFALQ